MCLSCLLDNPTLNVLLHKTTSTSWSRVQLPVVAQLCNDSKQVVHTFVPLSPNSIIWYRLTLCRWEGNRSSNVTLAVCYRLKCFILLQTQELENKHKQPTTLLQKRNTQHWQPSLDKTSKKCHSIPHFAWSCKMSRCDSSTTSVRR